MEMWRNLVGNTQMLVEKQQHEMQTDIAVFHLHQQWEILQDKIFTTKYPLVHIDSIAAQAARTLLLATDPKFSYIKMENALNFFGKELHDLSRTTIDHPIPLRRKFSYLWLQSHWLLCAKLEANNRELQKHKVPPPLPYPYIPSEVIKIHGLTEEDALVTTVERKRALEKALEILTPVTSTDNPEYPKLLQNNRP
jgi:hypothetical protein